LKSAARGALTEPASPRALGGEGSGVHGLQTPADGLVADGRLREVEADDDGPPFYVRHFLQCRTSSSDGRSGAAVLSAHSTTSSGRPMLERLVCSKQVIEV